MRILIFGDSHSSYFNLTDELKLIDTSFAGVDIRVVKLPGATINGFGKRESTLNTRSIFSEEFSTFKPDFVCFALGQVDIELGYYYRKIVKSEDVPMNNFISELCDNYIKTIKDIISQSNLTSNQVIIKGINLSVLTKSRLKAIKYTSRIINENITDKEKIKEYSEKIKNQFPSNLERYSSHVAFNIKLKEMILEEFKYFDINDIIEDKNCVGNVDMKFIPTGFDHHLSDSLYIRKIHLSRLLNTIFNIKT